MDDLLFVLLKLAFNLLGDFWPVVLAYLGFKLVRSLGRKMPEGKAGSKPVPRVPARPVLTPVEGGGFPRHVETVDPEPLPEREEPVLQAFEDDSSIAAPSITRLSVEESSPQPQKAEEANSSALAPDPREGLKWAMIFSPPRSKSPYRPPYRT